MSKQDESKVAAPISGAKRKKQNRGQDIPPLAMPGAELPLDIQRRAEECMLRMMK